MNTPKKKRPCHSVEWILIVVAKYLRTCLVLSWAKTQMLMYTEKWADQIQEAENRPLALPCRDQVKRHFLCAAVLGCGLTSTVSAGWKLGCTIFSATASYSSICLHAFPPRGPPVASPIVKGPHHRRQRENTLRCCTRNLCMRMTGDFWISTAELRDVQREPHRPQSADSAMN